MKFWASLGIKNEKNAEHLIRAFFREFNPESSIVIRGNEAVVEIVFDEPPTEIISAISYCEVKNFQYGKLLKTEKEETEQEEVAEKVSKQTDSKVVEILEKGNVTKKKQSVSKTNSSESLKPKLVEMAKGSTSYEDFIHAVAKWFAFEKREEIFVETVKAATQMQKVTWASIEKVLQEKGLCYTAGDKIFCTKKVSEKCEDSNQNVTIMQLIKELVTYQSFSFLESEKEESKSEVVELIQEEEKPEQEEHEEHEEQEELEYTAPEQSTKMPCMPEIPDFEKALNSVDKTQPIEERVKYVLTAMGWDKLKKEEKEEIFEITNTAVRLENIAFDGIVIKGNIPMENITKARMHFSKFLNDFVGKYDANRKVKLLDFLSELQCIIIFECEIEKLEDFDDENV